MMHCFMCQLPKYGPGNGFCFDCHNKMVQLKKAKNRMRLKNERMAQIDGTLRTL